MENCCTKSAGWGKWTSDDQFNTIFIDVKDFHNDGSLKYGGGTDKKGWFLIIRNITKHDFNISYSCTYGFQVSKKKMLLKKDAFSGKHGKYSLLFTFQNLKNSKSYKYIHCMKPLPAAKVLKLSKLLTTILILSKMEWRIYPVLNEYFSSLYDAINLSKLTNLRQNAIPQIVGI